MFPLIIFFGAAAGVILGLALTMWRSHSPEHYEKPTVLHPILTQRINAISAALSSASKGRSFSELPDIQSQHEKATETFAQARKLFDELGVDPEKMSQKKVHSVYDIVVRLQAKVEKIRDAAGVPNRADRAQGLGHSTKTIEAASKTLDEIRAVLDGRWTWPAMAPSAASRKGEALEALRRSAERLHQRAPSPSSDRGPADEFKADVERVARETEQLQEGDWKTRPTVDTKDGKTLNPSVSSTAKVTDLLSTARNILGDVRADYLAYETDVSAQINFPEMVDTNVPATAEMVQKIAAAQVAIDTASGPVWADDVPRAEEALAAAQSARTAFGMAEDSAKKRRWNKYTKENQLRLKDSRVRLELLLGGTLQDVQAGKVAKEIVSLLSEVFEHPVESRVFDKLVETHAIEASVVRLAITA